MKSHVAWSLLVAASSVIQAQDISDLLPALKTLPAPASVQEGVRFSYYGSIGDIPNDDYSKWAGDNGEWDYNTAPSGHGYTQIDVVAVSQGVAALSLQAWQYLDWSGPLLPLRGGQSSLVCYAGGGDWWVHPQALAQAQATQTDELTILKVNHILDGVGHAALRIQRVLPGSRTAMVYDLQTGMLLFKGTAVQTANTTFASQIYYKGSRQLPFAGGGQPTPAWLRAGVAWDYAGTYTVEVWGNAPFNLPLSAHVQIQRAGDRWFAYDQTTTLQSINGLPPTVEKTSLVGGDNLYIAPQTLRALRTGTVLDTDPITGARLAVTQTGATVTLESSAGGRSTTEFDFDIATGIMNGFRSRDTTDPLSTTSSRLTIVQMPNTTSTAAPELQIARQGNQIRLRSKDEGAYTISATFDGRRWEKVGTLDAGQEWADTVNPQRPSVWYRLEF